MSSPSVRTEGRDGPSRDTAEAESAQRDGARPAGAVASTAGVAASLDPGEQPDAGSSAPDATAWQRAEGSPWAVPDGGHPHDLPEPQAGTFRADARPSAADGVSARAATTKPASGSPWPQTDDRTTTWRRPARSGEAGAPAPAAAGDAHVACPEPPAQPAAEPSVQHDVAGGTPWPLWAAPRPHPSDPPGGSGPPSGEPEPAHGYAEVPGWDDGLIARRAEAVLAVHDDGTAGQAPVADDPAYGGRPPAGEAVTPATRDTERSARWEAEAAVRFGEQPSTARTPVAGGPARSVRAELWSEAPRRLGPAHAEDEVAPAAAPTALRSVRRWEGPPVPDPAEGPLRRRLGALRELIGLSRARVAPELLAEAAGVLDAAEARGRLSCTHTTIALTGATGSGKSSLINALAERELSPVGARRPTTAEPVACTWENGRDVAADELLDRLGVAPRDRRRVRDPRLRGLVLIDLPDHDSLEPGHREQVDRLLGLVDAVVWVVDPEKYADALLHEQYLRPFAGHAEVTFVVLNQTDRLPGDATDVVLDDLRRLLDEDGMALGEHGEPGARVLATSALTGDGLAELREELGVFVAARRAPVRRLTADVDGAVGAAAAGVRGPGGDRARLPDGAGARGVRGPAGRGRRGDGRRTGRGAGLVAAGGAGLRHALVAAGALARRATAPQGPLRAAGRRAFGAARPGSGRAGRPGRVRRAGGRGRPAG